MGMVTGSRGGRSLVVGGWRRWSLEQSTALTGHCQDHPIARLACIPARRALGDMVGWDAVMDAVDWGSLRTRSCDAQRGALIEVRFTAGTGLAGRARRTGKDGPSRLRTMSRTLV